MGNVMDVVRYAWKFIATGVCLVMALGAAVTFFQPKATPARDVLENVQISGVGFVLLIFIAIAIWLKAD